MSRHEALKSAIKNFQSDAMEAPILYSATEMNGKGYKALLGRQLRSIPISVAEWIIMILFLVAGTAATIIVGTVGTPSFAATFTAVFIVFFVQRLTIVSVGDNNLYFYFIKQKSGSKFDVYDKIILPYDKITNVNVKTGKFNTTFRFEFSIDDKIYKLRAIVPNKKKKMAEQAVNLKHLLEKVS